MTFCDMNNTAQWIGLYRSSNDENLIQFLGSYLFYLASATLFATVLYYQRRKRFLNGESSDRPNVLFANITREDADKSVNRLMKYLFNYGFYKFGVEVTLIMLVMLISFRRDTVSLVYLIWLCALIGMKRRTKQFIWTIFLYFVTISIIAQYAIILNVPYFLYPSKSI